MLERVKHSHFGVGAILRKSALRARVIQHDPDRVRPTPPANRNYVLVDFERYEQPIWIQTRFLR